MIIFICITITYLVKRALAFFRLKREQKQHGCNEGRRQKIKLTPFQEQQILRAKKLIKQGKVDEAASIYLAMGDHRTAIELFVDHKMQEKACEILKELRKPHRAGMVLARSNKWVEAQELFKEANMLEQSELCKYKNDLEQEIDQDQNILRFKF